MAFMMCAVTYTSIDLTVYVSTSLL